MVEQFQDELLPVATELTSRLVSISLTWQLHVVLLTRERGKCESYLRLAREGLSQASEVALDSVDIDTLLDTDEDKVYGAMGVAKTISTVGLDLSLPGVGTDLHAKTHAYRSYHQ